MSGVQEENQDPPAPPGGPSKARPATHSLEHRRTRVALLGFALVAALFAYGFRLARVQGRSMEPTFSDGQVLLVRRLNWPSTPVGVGDVIVFRIGRDLLVKRIAATAGGRVPGRPMLMVRPSRKYPGRWERIIIASPPREVPEGYVYVLGDNAAVSIDSRSFGLVPVSVLIGRVIHWKEITREGDTEKQQDAR